MAGAASSAHFPLMDVVDAGRGLPMQGPQCVGLGIRIVVVLLFQKYARAC
jgi:hypothetical protein